MNPIDRPGSLDNHYLDQALGRCVRRWIADAVPGYIDPEYPDEWCVSGTADYDGFGVCLFTGHSRYGGPLELICSWRRDHETTDDAIERARRYLRTRRRRRAA